MQHQRRFAFRFSEWYKNPQLYFNIGHADKDCNKDIRSFMKIFCSPNHLYSKFIELFSLPCFRFITNLRAYNKLFFLCNNEFTEACLDYILVPWKKAIQSTIPGSSLMDWVLKIEANFSAAIPNKEMSEWREFAAKYELPDEKDFVKVVKKYFVYSQIIYLEMEKKKKTLKWTSLNPYKITPFPNSIDQYLQRCMKAVSDSIQNCVYLDIVLDGYINPSLPSSLLKELVADNLLGYKPTATTNPQPSRNL